MKYFQLLYDYCHSDPYLFCDQEELHGMNRYCVEKAEAQKDLWITPEFSFEKDNNQVFSDYLSNVLHWFIVSDRFVEVAGKFINDSVEYLPVKIIDRETGITYHNYSVVNVLDMVDALDLENSDYRDYNISRLDKPYRTIIRFSLFEKAVEGHHIFRIKDHEMPIILSEAVKKAVKKAKLTCFDFGTINLT